MRRMNRTAFTLIELLVVIVILAVLIAVLLPVLSNVKKSAMMSRMASEHAPAAAMNDVSRHAAGKSTAGNAPPTQRTPISLAHVSSFEADITLTPRLSVGTAEPESIYEAKFAAKIKAAATGPVLAADADRDGIADAGLFRIPVSGVGGATTMPAGIPSRIELPLPPQIISLADLSVTVDGKPSDSVTMQDDKLIWEGPLPAGQPAEVNVTYAAVGRGLYSLQTPPGKILEQFKIRLTAAGSDVRMLELSMQPTSLTREGGKTVYLWEYHKLMFGRPIALDVLGIAPIDRLGELSWLGPLSVVAFGLVIGLIAHAFGVANFDRWMLMLVLGAFAGAYPLMYFAQEFIPLSAAIGTAGGVVLLIIAWRSVSIMGIRLGALGVVIPGAAIMSLALTAALRPAYQGILLTVLSLAVFVLAMILGPKLKHLSPRKVELELPPEGAVA